jgi:ketosteroid isomerase-like protein
LRRRRRVPDHPVHELFREQEERSMSENASAAATLAAVDAFNAATNAHDIDGMMALMTDDCVFENTSPSPDGERYTGQAAVRAFWQRLLDDTPQARFEAEEIFAYRDRCVVRWTYHWSEDGHVRGIDVFRVRDGKIAEKLAYVKG